MAFHPKGRDAVGIGHCDLCDMRLFLDSTFVVDEGVIYCEDCIEEMSE